MGEKSQINFLRLAAILRGGILFRAEGAKLYTFNKLREVFGVVKRTPLAYLRLHTAGRDTQAALVIIEERIK
jgi:hypothetical protein